MEKRAVHFITSSDEKLCRRKRADEHGKRVAWNIVQYRESKQNWQKSSKSCVIYQWKDTLKAIHKTMDKRKTHGIDKVKKEDYERNLEENLSDLVKRMKSGSYRLNPTRRVYIPKETKGKTRPLGISCYEDKLVENTIAQILEQIYESKFYNESFGFRSNRNCH